MSFFFQAEDGIRDDLVTGVQTCALPILNVGCNRRGSLWAAAYRAEKRESSSGAAHMSRISRSKLERSNAAHSVSRAEEPRSEERRVGKECGYRWAPDW